jgi:hypothetical protein
VACANTVIVQLPTSGPRETPETIELSPGENATFGRGDPMCPVDMPIPDPAVSRTAGCIRAVEDHWVISNLSRMNTYVVENPEGAGEFIKVSPRRADMPVPFEFARLIIPVTQGAISFQVFAPQHLYLDLDANGQDRPDQQTVHAFPLDETAKYFLVLVAMCEPSLRSPSAVAIPTAREIVSRLSPLVSCRNLSVSAVHFHIDYLASHKLRIKRYEDEPGLRYDWQRSALVSLALRFNLVREEHLALLPSQRISRRVPGSADG